MKFSDGERMTTKFNLEQLDVEFRNHTLGVFESKWRIR